MLTRTLVYNGKPQQTFQDYRNNSSPNNIRKPKRQNSKPKLRNAKRPTLKGLIESW